VRAGRQPPEETRVLHGLAGAGQNEVLWLRAVYLERCERRLATGP
jgi:hypothetical protein